MYVTSSQQTYCGTEVKRTSTTASSSATSELGKERLSALKDLAEVLSVELRNQLVELIGVGLDAHGRKRLGDIVGGGTVVPAEDKHEVCGHVLHAVDL